MKNKLVDIFTSEKMIFAFAIGFMLLCFLTFTYITAQVKYLTYLSYVIAAWGLVIIVISLFNAKRWCCGKITLLLLLFVASYLISSLFVLNYGILGNVKGLIWLSLELFVLFIINKSNIDSKFLKYFLIIFIYISTLYVFISITMAVVGYMHYPTSLPGDLVPGGMAHGRLYGLYADPNYGAFTSTLCILSCLFLLYKNRNKFYIFLTLLIALLNLIYISLSGSRSGLISLLVSVMIICILSIKLVWQKNVFIALMSSVLICFGMFALNIGIETAYENIEPQILKNIGGPISDPKHAFTLQFADKVREECGLENPYLANNGTPEEEANKTIGLNSGEVISEHVGILGREENTDVTNQRKDIWLSAIDLVEASPIIGLSNRNYVEFAKENIPDTYISKIEFQSMHNIFIDVAVSQGIIGLAFWLLILLCIFISLVKELNKKKSYKIIILLGAFIAFMVMGLFYTEMIYVNTIGSVYFWYVFGHLPYDKIHMKRKG